MVFTPLCTGFCALPHIRLSWEKDGRSTVILEIGGGTSPNKYLYVLEAAAA